MNQFHHRLLLAVSLAMTFAAFAGAAEPDRIRVLCYNIHYGQGMDGKYDIERLAAVINHSKPDLVALQEVDVGVKRSGRIHEAQLLGKMTGMHVQYGPTQHYEGGLFGNAVLSRMPMEDVLIQPLPYTEATPELVTYPRGAIAVTVRAPNGKPLRFISTHFQHNVAEDRVAEAKAINSLFASDDGSIPTILAGDMNATPDAEPVQILLKRWSNATDDPPAPSAPSVNPKSRIDYIFYRSADSLRAVDARVIDEAMASDHRPIQADFIFVTQ